MIESLMCTLNHRTHVAKSQEWLYSTPNASNLLPHALTTSYKDPNDAFSDPKAKNDNFKVLGLWNNRLSSQNRLKLIMRTLIRFLYSWAPRVAIPTNGRGAKEAQTHSSSIDWPKDHLGQFSPN